MQRGLTLLLPCFFYFCFTPSQIMKVDRQLRFPFPLPLSFPFAGPHDFLAQSCYVWAPICQAVINSKKNLFLLNYFWNVKQTCLNYVAANSTLRSSLDFMLIQVEERNQETKIENAENPSSISWENSFFNYSSIQGQGRPYSGTQCGAHSGKLSLEFLEK